MNFKKRYRDLEMQVLRKLREKISESGYRSAHTGKPAIKIHDFGYTELTVINDRLTFINRYGYHCSVFANTSLEDLVEILDNLN